MSGGADRAARVAAAARERALDLLLVTNLVSLRWLTGFTGSNGAAVLDVASAPERPGTFLTDFRYVTQIETQVDPAWERRQSAQELLGAGLAEVLTEPAGAPPRLGFDDRHLTVAQFERLREALDGRVDLVAAGGLLEALREVKDTGEVSRIREAAHLADRALTEVLERGLVGRTEAEVALDLEIAMRRHGAEALSFEPIVASGAHGALPHAEPRGALIDAGVLVTIDWGAQLEGYCSDCTRTFATGGIGDEERAVYDLVLQAQEAALGAVRPGPTGREVDAVARDLITAAGHGEHFGHGLGHGVGLEVHEGPRLSKTGEQPLAPGMIVTVEPGVYLPGRCGVRIEDLVVVTEDGHEVLNTLPKALQVVG